jgi:hypothetical protein
MQGSRLRHAHDPGSEVLQTLLDAVWEETRAHLERRYPERLAAIERSPKQKVAHIFRWYVAKHHPAGADRQCWPARGYQTHCGPAMGAFNPWVTNSEREPAADPGRVRGL